jgi:hypothetical protein
MIIVHPIILRIGIYSIFANIIIYLSSFVIPLFEVDNKDSVETPLVETIDEYTEEEDEEPPTIMPAAQTIKQQQQAPGQGVSRTHYKYKEDEIRWDAVFQSSRYISKGYNRDEIIIEPPASFDGAEGTYQVAFENDNRILVVKIAPNPVLSDPHAINSYYAKMYGIMTADDSARHQAFKVSAKAISDKWYTFRYHLDWPGKPSEDIGMVPWLDYAEFDSEGRAFPLIILNISSISPVDEKSKKTSAKLVKKAFKSPSKVKGVNMAGDTTAQMASLLEGMIKAGTMTPEMKAAVRKFGGMDHDSMYVDDEDDESRSNKRHSSSSSNTVG